MMRTISPSKLFKGIHGLVGNLKQTMYCMHAYNDSSNQNSKTLRDAKNQRKDDGCFQNGVEDWRRNV
jgi:hypothetical protein